MKKAIIILSSITLAFWLLTIVVGISIGFSTQDAINGGNAKDLGEAIGLAFAAVFITLFSIAGYAVAIIAGLASLTCLASIIVVCKTTNKKGLIAIGIISIILGNLVAGIITLVYNSKIHKE